MRIIDAYGGFLETKPETEVNTSTPKTDGVSVMGDTATTELDAKVNVPEFAPSPWDNGFNAGLTTLKDKPIYDAINGYNAYANERGKAPLDILEMWPMMQKGYDFTKSPEENEQDEKKRARKEKWERTNNFLAHLGSWIGALAGGPAQPIESSVELTNRQQALRDRTLEQRRQANRDYLGVYQAQQAAKRAEAKEKREENYQNQMLALKQSAEERARDAQTLQELKLQWQMEYQQGLLDVKKQQQEIERQYKLGRLSLDGRKLAFNELNANYTKTKTDANGNVTTETRTVGGVGSTQRQKVDY